MSFVIYEKCQTILFKRVKTKLWQMWLGMIPDHWVASFHNIFYRFLIFLVILTNVTEKIGYVSLYTQVYRCFEVRKIPSWVISDTHSLPQHNSSGGFLRGHGLKIHHQQYQCWRPLSMWVPSFLPGYISVRGRGHWHIGSGDYTNLL